METQSIWQKDCIKISNWAKSIGLIAKRVSNKDVSKIIRKSISEINRYSFLSNVWVKKGIIYYNDLAHPGDLLHELGHLAVTPSWLRLELSENLEETGFAHQNSFFQNRKCNHNSLLLCDKRYEATKAFPEVVPTTSVEKHIA
jgi:hypothetical protein